jgi:hypothetical protein
LADSFQPSLIFVRDHLKGVPLSLANIKLGCIAQPALSTNIRSRCKRLVRDKGL